ncbi:MAG: hypothetical protein HZB10_03155, partial [Candidatus Yonathbacteria bacterium]|nr:hypothetical protein [Candidatus Yonathbacteria bacterium]
MISVMQKFFKRTALFVLVVAFAFSNVVSLLPQILQNNKLAESLKIKEAQAAITYETPGAVAYSASGGTSVAPVHPATVNANDLLVLIIGMKPSTANSGSVTTPSGWTAVPSGSLTGAGGYSTTLGADTGNTNVFTYYKVAAGTEDGTTLTVTIATNNVSWAQIYRLSNASGSWSVAGTTGSDVTGDAAVSVAMSANPGVTAGDYILGAMVIPTDVTTPSQFTAEAFSQTGITFGTVTEISEPDSLTGNDIGGVVVWSSASSGTASAAPTMTATAGGTVTNVRGPGVFVRVQETNTAPTLTVTQPDGVGDTVNVGDLYNITYDLADPDPLHNVTAAMYYDTDATGLNGTAITGACATAAEGTGATCSWNTTGMTPGTYYVYGITNDGIAAQVSDYSPGMITINAPADTTPPTPNPMTFSSVPNNTSATQIDMTATTATDATTPPVSYYFALDTASCTPADVGSGAADSGWQSGTTYSDTGLSVNKCYGYKVKARDSVATPNETGYSGITTLYTSANIPGTPALGSPTATTLALTNTENSNPSANPTTYFAVQVVTTSDGAWINKWVDATGNPSASAVWLTDAQLDAIVLQGLQSSTLYGVKVKARNQDTDETALSAEGQGTTSAPAVTLTISQTAGSKVTTKNSGDVNQYAHDTACTGAATCSAFTLASAGGTANVTSIKVTESGTATANTELSDLNLYYDYDGNWSDAGAETLFGTVANFAGDQTATVSGTLAITTGQTAYIYARYDLANGAVYPTGGATVNFQIAASGDVVSDATESGTGSLAGTQTVRPNVTNATDSALVDGGKNGDTFTITGTGFGTACGSISVQVEGTTLT